MTRKGRNLLIILFIFCMLLREEVISFFFRATSIRETENQICEIKNKELETKYQELVASYGYEENIEYTTEKSKVLFNNIYDLEKSLMIYKGSKEGIKPNFLVVNENGLVGIIKEVYKHSSKVLLLTNKETNLSVKVGNSYGILTSKDGKLQISGIDNKQEISKNMEVRTSDLSLYPENILIGYVENVEMDTYEIEQKISVTPAVSSIKYVSIITELRGVE